MDHELYYDCVFDDVKLNHILIYVTCHCVIIFEYVTLKIQIFLVCALGL